MLQRLNKLLMQSTPLLRYIISPPFALGTMYKVADSVQGFTRVLNQ